MWCLLLALYCFSCNVICSFSNSTKGDHTGSSTETRYGLVIQEKEHTFPSTETSSASAVSNREPCFVDDLFAELREGVGSDGELTNRSLALFGVCTASDNSSGSVLLELTKETSRNQRRGLEVLHPAGGNSALWLQHFLFECFLKSCSMSCFLHQCSWEKMKEERSGWPLTFHGLLYSCWTLCCSWRLKVPSQEETWTWLSLVSRCILTRR